jgi:hypothetical protein
LEQMASMHNTYMFAAGVLALAVGAIHSVLGEIMIFSRMRQRGIIPTMGAPVLRERHVRILWASWHMVTAFGWASGAVLLRLAFASPDYPIRAFVEGTIIISMLFNSLLVLIASKGMHPGWAGLLGVAVLAWVGIK